MKRDSIKSVLRQYPRAGLIQSDAIIHKLPRVSSQAGYSIYILRDDLTGFALGGNKTRKLDYLVGDAIAVDADTLITMKASSFSRNAAAAGRVCGLDVHVMLLGNQTEQNTASQAFFHQYGAKLHYVPQEDALAASYKEAVESLKRQGKAVYELHPGGSDSIGALGYVDAFGQIVDYSQRSGIHFSSIIHSTGSAGTQAGLVVGQCISGYDTHVLGISASQETLIQTERIRELASNTARMLGVRLDETKIAVDDGFIGPGYAVPSDEGRNAAGVFATLEGILLDHVYTAKAAAALLHYTSKKVLEGENVLFVHTGGNSGIYY